MPVSVSVTPLTPCGVGSVSASLKRAQLLLLLLLLGDTVSVPPWVYIEFFQGAAVVKGCPLLGSKYAAG